MVYYVIKQDDTTCHRQIIPAGEIVVKAKYLIFIQENTNWYWEHKKKQQVIVVPTQTIVYACLDVVAEKYVHGIPIIICNRNQAKNALQKHRIRLTDSDHEYILE